MRLRNVDPCRFSLRRRQNHCRFATMAKMPEKHGAFWLPEGVYVGNQNPKARKLATAALDQNEYIH